MQTFAEFRPTGFDRAGAFLPDQQGWLVLPCGRNRDSGTLDESNFEAALDELGGESDTVQVHRFGHWACGWFEVIIVAPDSAAAEMAESIEAALLDYPILDESAYYVRQHESYLEQWDRHGASDFSRNLRRNFHLSDAASDLIDYAADSLALREFFESLLDGDYIDSDDASPRVYAAAKACTRDLLAAFLWSVRRASKAKAEQPA